MLKPIKLARGHAIVLVVGGKYRGSVIDASVIRNTDDSVNRTRECLVEFSTIDSKSASWRQGWNWAKKDIKWTSREKLADERRTRNFWDGRLFHDGVEDNVDAKTRKAIKEYGGAWVIRLRI